MPRIDELLTLLKQEGGSDLHLAAGLVPRLRVRGELRDVEGWAMLGDEGLRELLRPIASDEHWGGVRVVG